MKRFKKKLWRLSMANKMHRQFLPRDLRSSPLRLFMKRGNKVFLLQKIQLVAVLAQVGLSEEIPEELYHAVVSDVLGVLDERSKAEF